MGNELKEIIDLFEIEYITNKETGERTYRSNKLNRKIAEYDELVSEKDFYLQKIETLEDKYEKCKQSLDEIKDLLFQVTHADFDDDYERAYRDLQNNFRETQKQILGIINKVNGGNNETQETQP